MGRLTTINFIDKTQEIAQSWLSVFALGKYKDQGYVTKRPNDGRGWPCRYGRRDFECITSDFIVI
jgi:hypothetical protein